MVPDSADLSTHIILKKFKVSNAEDLPKHAKFVNDDWIEECHKVKKVFLLPMRSMDSFFPLLTPSFFL